jgi:hypothetical protein
MDARWRTIRRLTCLFCLIIAVGLLLAVWKLPDFGLRTTFRWDRVDGTVIQSEMKQMRVPEGMQFKAGIVYSYRVQEREYRNNQVEFVDLYQSDEAGAQRILGEFPAGKTITVLYNPDAPNQSMIRHRQFLELVIFVVVPILLFGFAFFLWRWDL